MIRIGPFAALALLALAACKPVNEPQFDPQDVATQSAAAAVPTAVAARAGVKGCPDYPFVNDGTRTRKAPLPVPAALAGIVSADRDHYAVSALGGGTVCVDTRSMEQVKGLSLSPDKRFVSFEWDGMEAFGHIVVDRIGEGVAVDTGTAPSTSPAGRRLAAVDWSESAFGALNAFAVWEKAPAGLREIGRVESPPEGFTEWKIEGWQGEGCVTLSAVSFAQSAENADGKARARFLAHPDSAGNWVVGPAAKERCAAQ